MHRDSGSAQRIADRFGPGLRRKVACSACGRLKAEVTHMIAGPNVYICDGCVGQAARQLSARQSPPDGVRCHFCSRGRAPDALTVVGGVALCADCLGLMETILAEAAQSPPPAT